MPIITYIWQILLLMNTYCVPFGSPSIRYVVTVLPILFYLINYEIKIVTRSMTILKHRHLFKKPFCFNFRFYPSNS